MSSSASSIQPPLSPGDKVRTPSGRMADLIAIYPNEGEGMVMWCDKQTAIFRLTLLKPWRE